MARKNACDTVQIASLKSSKILSQVIKEDHLMHQIDMRIKDARGSEGSSGGGALV